MKISLIIFLMAIAAACNKSDETKVDTCIDESKINPDALCTMHYDPVCGCDGKTYSNSCVAASAGVTEYTPGECPTVD